MNAPEVRVSRDWLALREPADAAARARELVEPLRTRRSPTGGSWVIHDLAGGTGAMGRWLAPRLHGAQHWIVHDLDADLLKVAAARPPGPAADRSAVTLEVKHTDITRLRLGDFTSATLITASALLDVLTEAELIRLIAACAQPGCPVLFTLTVIGRVELAPADRLDHRVAAAFNAHQRRVTKRGSLLGPNAVELAVEQFGRWGRELLVRPSSWRLGASRAGLAAEWFRGWVGAACEQEAELAEQAAPYVGRRLAQASAGELAVSVGHCDLLALPS